MQEKKTFLSKVTLEMAESASLRFIDNVQQNNCNLVILHVL